MKRIVLSLCLLAGAAGANGQTPAPAFTTADVRVSKPGTAEGLAYVAAGRAEFRGATMVDLIAGAYGVRRQEVLGGPTWLATNRFDLSARAENASEEATRTMLQALLAERFKLEIHKENRDLPIYALTVATRGSKLKAPADAKAAPECKGDGGMPDVTWQCRNMGVPGFVERLRETAGQYIDRPIEDQTGLKGSYDFTVTWTRRAQLRRPGEEAQGVNLSLFDALDRQLGLKLEAGKRAAPVIVVDRVNEIPSGNPENTAAQPKAPLKFELASIRPATPGAVSTGRALPSGQVELMGVSLKTLIMAAYDVTDEYLAGQPKWLDADRFDLLAKGPRTDDSEDIRGMLQSLLEERFKLAVHRGEQPVPVYALQPGGRAAKLKESSGSERADCKQTVENGANGSIMLTCRNTTMAQLAAKLRDAAPAYLEYPVVDLTGLKGSYDFVLNWAPKNKIIAGGAGQQEGALPVAATPTGDLTIFEAVDKQLGLKLAQTKHPMPVLIIDRVERTPTEN